MKYLAILSLAIMLTGCPKPMLCDFDGSGSVDASDLAAQEAAFNQVSDIYDVTGDGIVLGDDMDVCMGES